MMANNGSSGSRNCSPHSASAMIATCPTIAPQRSFSSHAKLIASVLVAAAASINPSGKGATDAYNAPSGDRGRTSPSTLGNSPTAFVALKGTRSNCTNPVAQGKVFGMRGYARSLHGALTGSRAPVLTVIVATVLSSWTVQPARAHLFPPDLAFYGPFGAPT